MRENRNNQENKGQVALENKFDYYPTLKIDKKLNFAFEKREEVNNIFNQLPGIDCGACGVSSCRELAENIYKISANKSDCVVLKNIKNIEF
jgi:Na+-translocating ferredoxin:NAD+ oxidoreductase RNF subunit RnfB